MLTRSSLTLASIKRSVQLFASPSCAAVFTFMPLHVNVFLLGFDYSGVSGFPYLGYSPLNSSFNFLRMKTVSENVEWLILLKVKKYRLSFTPGPKVDLRNLRFILSDIKCTVCVRLELKCNRSWL